ncbi:hypothetical protein [Chitinibacter tainanensis]|uniref:hypothetical protein n=1 Tax=Chitinibacter tainanensis TaxID=230667 RepID=UPI002357C7F6|nr:hypothetical protein [Chitinibacter tainanensis]
MKKTLIAFGFVLASNLAFADGDMKPMHNGVMAEATSGNRAELSLDSNMLMIYLSDHAGKAVAAKGVAAELTLLNGSEKQTVKLMPMGDGFMATGQYKAVAGTKALLKVTLPGKAAEQFRFALK